LHADRFLVDLFKDKTRGALADQRFHGMFHRFRQRMFTKNDRPVVRSECVTSSSTKMKEAADEAAKDRERSSATAGLVS